MQDTAMQKTHLNTIVWKEGKHYVAQCLTVDVSSFGPTKKAALANLNEAVALYFENETKPRVVAIKNPELVALRLQRV